MEFVHGVFNVFKFLFGLGALGTLLAIGLALLWYLLRWFVCIAFRNRPAAASPLLRKLFLEP